MIMIQFHIIAGRQVFVKHFCFCIRTKLDFFEIFLKNFCFLNLAHSQNEKNGILYKAILSDFSTFHKSKKPTTDPGFSF